MTTLRDAAQQALEALDSYSWEQVYAARTALRAALEQQAEPVQVQRNYLVIKNEFYGDPPAPYATWGEAMAAMLDAGVIKGLTISAREAK